MTERHPSRAPHGRSDRPVPAEYSEPADGFTPSALRTSDPFAEEGSVSFRSHLTGLYRYKWVLLLASVLGAAGAYYAWHQVEPEYVAQGSLWVRGNAMSDVGPITSEGILPTQSWMDLLRSFTVLDPVVQAHKLYLTPSRPEDLELFDEFEIADNLVSGSYALRISDDGSMAVLSLEGEEVDRAPVGDSIGRAQGILWATPSTDLGPGREVEFSLSTPRSAAVRLQDQILSNMDPRGSFILLQLSGQDPDRIAAVINGLMENHVDLATELKRGTLDQEFETVSNQLRTAEAELSDAERALESFRVQTITLPSEDSRAIQPGLEMTRGPVMDEFFEMRVREEELSRDLERLRRIAAQLEEGDVPLEAIEMIPSAQGATQLQAALDELLSARGERRVLLQRYTEEYPAVAEVTERVRELENQRIPSLLSQFIQQMEAEEQILSEQIANSEADLTQIPPRAIEEARLRRRVEISAQLYTELEGRFQFANLARATSQPDIQILDRASAPEVPANDPRATLALAVFSIVFGVGVAGALVANHLDSRLHTPDEVQSAFGLTLLGAIPRIVGGGKREGMSAIKNAGQVREAFRELRTNLTYAFGSAGPIVFTISSPAMEEGKTTTTTNLGVAFSELGHRTLIIDADTRRGDLYQFLGGFRRPGLTDYLLSTSSGEEVLQHTEHEGLDFIASGTHVANSPELLSSREMGRMMSALKQRYDVIIVDSPPLGAGADSLVLSSITGHLMVVVRSGSTNRGFTQAKLEPLNRLPVRVLGVVLNDYEPSRLASGGDSYYAAYLPGYEATEESDRPTPAEEGSAAIEGERRLTAGAGAGASESGRFEGDRS